MLSIRIAMCFLAIVSFAAHAEAGFWDNIKGLVARAPMKAPPQIDVLIVNDKPGVLLEVRGNYQLRDPNKNELLSKRYIGKKKYLQALSGGLRWGEEFPGLFQLQIVPEDPAMTTVVDGVEYRGTLFIYDIGGSISIVNRIPIENYLKSILPSKFNEDLPEETLAALVIASRTDAYYQTQNPRSRFWAVDAAQVGYRGVESERCDSAVEHAIDLTRHMALSKTGVYEGTLTTFPTKWSKQSAASGHQNGGAARISIGEAEDMARNGSHAAQILSRAFPGSHIEILY